MLSSRIPTEAASAKVERRYSYTEGSTALSALGLAHSGCASNLFSALVSSAPPHVIVSHTLLSLLPQDPLVYAEARNLLRRDSELELTYIRQTRHSASAPARNRQTLDTHHHGELPTSNPFGLLQPCTRYRRPLTPEQRIRFIVCAQCRCERLCKRPLWLQCA
jgi:hypothetical protein